MQEIITAKKGFLYTDGVTTYGREVLIGEDRSEDDFHEINEEEYEAILEKEAEKWQ